MGGRFVPIGGSAEHHPALHSINSVQNLFTYCNPSRGMVNWCHATLRQDVTLYENQHPGNVLCGCPASAQTAAQNASQAFPAAGHCGAGRFHSVSLEDEIHLYHGRYGKGWGSALSDPHEPFQLHRYEGCLRHFLPQAHGHRHQRGRHVRHFRQADAAAGLRPHP